MKKFINGMKKFFDDIVKYKYYMVHAAKSELKAEVANSYLNWVWWILEPLCFMFVYYIIFGVFFNSKKAYFTAFIFIGITMWDFFNRLVQGSVRSVKRNKSIVSKVYVPKYILIIEKMFMNGFKMMIGFGIVAVLIICFRIKLTLNVLWFIPILFGLFTVTFGVSCFVLHYGVYVEDLSNIVSIVLRLMFYLTGIFYDIEEKVGKTDLASFGVYFNKVNPMALLISSMRNVLLYGQAPHYKWIIAWFLGGIVVSVFGIRIIQKNENSYVKVI